MASDLSPETWAQIRYDYEHTDRPVEDICAAHGISSGTLRDRRRRWGWARRRPPVPREGPAPFAPTLPSAHVIAPLFDGPCGGEIREEDRTDAGVAPELPSPHIPRARRSDDGGIVPRLQGAAARVLPAIESTLAKLGAGPLHPREMEQAARALGTLTRTLRELNALQGEHRPPSGCLCDAGPEDIDEFRRELARKMDAFIEARTGKPADDAEPPQE
jgi:transposase-like protein